MSQQYQIIHNMLKKISSTICGFDLFTALPTLRMRGQPQVNNLCSGMFSICLFSFFIYIFVSNLISTINLQRIYAKQTIQTNQTFSKITNIQIAVGIQYRNMSQLRNIFQLKAFTSQAGKPNIPIGIQPCTRQMWSQFDDTKYTLLNLQHHMCLKKQQVQLYGENGTPNMQIVYLSLSICNNATSPVTCASQAVIDQQFAQSMIFGRYMACSLVILDTGFNPNNQIPVAYSAYQKTLWLIFNRQQYIMTQTIISTYHIMTDTSFLPITNQTDQYGYYVSQSMFVSVKTPNNQLLLVQSFIFSSSYNKIIQRQYGKADDVLSYVGGLFGIIVSFFAFFLLSFNQYKYQLRVSQGAFSTDTINLSKQAGFHFFKYLKYSIYDWIKTFLRCQPNWQDCVAIQEARQEANQQIDVKYLLQRIGHVELVMRSQNFDKQGDKVMYMVRHSPIQQAKNRRIFLEYCDKFIDGTAGMTIETIQNINALWEFSSTFKTNSLEIQNYSSSNIPNSKIDQDQKKNKQKTSLEIIEQYIHKYNDELKLFQSTLQIDQQNLKAQEQLATSFYSMNQKKRLKIVKNIPIGILYRLSKIQNQLQPKDNSINNLSELKPLKINKRRNIIQHPSLIQYKE